MQNVQNADIQRVINLVDFYRTKVGKESQKAKELAEEYKRQYDNEIDYAYALHEQGFEGYCLDIRIPEEAIDEIRVNEHLLGYFYKEVAGNDADSNVLSYFLAEKYDSTIFSEEEASFLKNHFAEMVNYIIQSPNNDLQAVEGDDRNDIYLLPTEVLRLIKERGAISSGSKIYNPFTGFSQLARLYPNCSFFCEESYMSFNKRWNAYCDKVRETEHIVKHKVDENKLYAWMKVVLYANSMDAIVIEDGSVPQDYDAVISYIPYIPSKVPNYAYYYANDNSSDAEIIGKIIKSYQNLANGGKMILILPTEYCWEKVVFASVEGTSYRLELEPLWKQMIADNSLVEIIQLPSVMGKTIHDAEYCIVIAEKGCKGKYVTFIDARYASRKSDGILFKQTLDLDALHTMIENGGKDGNTGLRKSVKIPRTKVNSDLLVPQVYVLEKPSESDVPVPLTELCVLGTAHIYDVKDNLPEDTPWVTQDNLTSTFRGTLDMSTIKKAGCPNNPEGWKYGNRELSNFLMGRNGYPEKDIHISRYRNCKYVDGRKDVVLFKLSKDGVITSVINATGSAIAVSPEIHILQPNDKIDALSLAAMLQMPVVYRQIETYEKFGLYGSHGHLKDIIVPTDKLILSDEIHRINNELQTYKKQEELLATKKTEYINEVRMRKHDLGQYIFELVNIEDLMRYYIENREKEKDYCHEIETLLDNFKSSLGELSTLLADLSKEEQFGNPEDFSLDNYLSQLVTRHKADGFKIVYERDVESIKKYNSNKHLENVLADDIQNEDDSIDLSDILDEGDSLDVGDILNEDNSLDVSDILDEGDSLDVSDILDEGDSLDVGDILNEDNSLDVSDILDEGDSLDVGDILNEDDSLDVSDILDEDDSLDVSDILDEDDSLDVSDILDEGDSLDVSDILDEGDSLDVSDTIDEGNSLSVDDLIVLDNNVVKSISDSIPTINIAKNDVQRAVNNIIDNARKHGFRGIKNNNNEIRIKLAIDTEKNMFQIDFRNNGYPLPDGMDKMRYGLKGEKAGETGGTGLGGNYVKAFVEYYGGDYDVFMENGWTVVRIYLPIK